MSAIVDKISKLLAQSESAAAIGNAEEAAAFSARASQLMDKYKVEMSDLEFASYLAEEEIDTTMIDWEELGHKNKRRSCAWTSFLSSSIAALFHCRSVHSRNTNRVVIYGHTTNRAVAIQVIGYLVRLADRLADEGQKAMNKIARETGDRRVAKGYRKSFLFAFVTTVHKRAANLINQREQEACGERGLMVLDEGRQVEDVLNNDPNIRNASTTVRGGDNHKGMADGEEAGKSVNIESPTAGLEAAKALK